MNEKEKLTTEKKIEKTLNKKYIGFMLGNQEFNSPISFVQEIIEIMPITRVPNVHNYVEGVFNLRGKVLPVIDLKKRLKIGEKNLTLDSRIIVFSHNSRNIGFIVDSITNVFELSDSMIEAPQMLKLKENNFILGVSKLENRLTLLLDIQKIIDTSRKK